MEKYRKKPVVIEAKRWFKKGDHPEVTLYNTHIINASEVKLCEECHRRGVESSMDAHGYIETLEGGHIVCPGDWIITGVAGEYYPCKPDIFKATYEKVKE